MSRFRRFTFTWNNYTKEDIEYIDTVVKPKSNYLIYGREVAPTTGTPHLQGYIEFVNARTLTTMKRMFKHQHVEPAKANASKNKEYCSKESIISESGVPKNQGQRNDIEAIVDAIRNGEINNLNDILDVNPGLAVRYGNKLQAVISASTLERTTKPNIRWIQGSSGTGKTRGVMEWSKKNGLKTYIKDNSKWWDGYNPKEHQVILIDDIDLNEWNFKGLLTLLDRYACRREIKGGYIEINSPHIFITTANNIFTHFNDIRDLIQLVRRIDKFITLYNNGSKKVETQQDIFDNNGWQPLEYIDIVEDL